jgi:hypothetical protein
MSRPPKPLSHEERDILLRFVEYDPATDQLVWKARKPADFGTKEPERTAFGFNRAKAGKPIALNAMGSFAVTTWAQRFTFSENKVRAFLGAPHRPIARYEDNMLDRPARTIRHPHARGTAARNTNPDGNMFDRAFIRKVIAIGPDRVLRWKPLLAREDKDMLEAAVRERLAGAKYEAGEIVTWRSMRMYNSRVAGTEVKVTTAGVVRLLRVIRISPYLLEQVFPGAHMGVTGPSTGPARPDIKDDDIRRVVGYDPKLGPVWKYRSKADWFALVMLQVEERVPDDAGVDAWNETHGGAPLRLVAGANRSNVYRFGARSIGLRRMHDVLAG